MRWLISVIIAIRYYYFIVTSTKRFNDFHRYYNIWLCWCTNYTVVLHKQCDVVTTPKLLLL
jgi:hypothetical protein